VNQAEIGLEVSKALGELDQHGLGTCPSCRGLASYQEPEALELPDYHCYSGCNVATRQQTLSEIIKGYPSPEQSVLQAKVAGLWSDLPVEDRLKRELHSGPALMRTQPAEREWLIDPIIPANELCGLTGDGGTGKTYFAIITALSIARGEFHGAPCRQVPTLYVTREESFDEIHRRVWNLTIKRGEQIPDLFNLQTLDAIKYTSLNERDRLSAFGEALFSMIEARGIRFAVFEMLPDFFDGNEIVRREVNTFFKAVVAPRAKEANCACLFLMHPSVAGLAEGTGRSGSTANFGSLRSVMFQRKVETGSAIKLVKANYRPTPREVCSLLWNDEAGGFDLSDPVEPERKPPQGKNQQALLNELPDDGEWVQQVRVRSTLDLKADRFADARTGLCKRGWAEVSPDGKQIRRLPDATN
jgi:hypothetical protein